MLTKYCRDGSNWMQIFDGGGGEPGSPLYLDGFIVEFWL